ncbi:hypothetical protein C6495_01515 [Candidatus Poribacteria bacterium]|nr:MAG: hypothetical protein C6495_01515 [Candidatus Poribacteria bacterium]
MRQVATIEHISISAGWEHEQAILVFDNRGQNKELIDIRYQESGKLNRSWKHFQLLAGDSRTVELPGGFEKCEKFYCRIGKKEWPNSIDDLRKLLDEAKAPADIEQPQLVNEPPSPEPEPASDVPLDSQKGGINETEGFQTKAEAVVWKTREQVAAKARAYREGQPIELGELETPTPSQKILVFLNTLAHDIGKWKTEVGQSGKANSELVDVLTYRKADIIAKLKAIRGESPPAPPPLSVKIERITDAELEHIGRDCAIYEARFEGMLIGYELGREVDIAEYDAFLPQFIADRLFNGVARCMPFEELSQRIDKFLHLVGYEIVPIEVGYTKADSRVHEIQDSQQTGDEPGTIVEVVLPGLQRIADSTIVQKPIVIRGE